MKQNRLRKRIVRRYATLYFIILIIFVALVVGPLVAGIFFNLITKLIPQEIKFQQTLLELSSPTGASFNQTMAIQIKPCLTTSTQHLRIKRPKKQSYQILEGSGGIPALILEVWHYGKYWAGNFC